MSVTCLKKRLLKTSGVKVKDFVLKVDFSPDLWLIQG